MKIIGHRGAKGLAPENTLKAFEKALEHHVDIIETDIHITKDGVPVLEHDDNLKNQAGDQLRVVDHSYADLLKHKPDLASLDEAITFINRRAPFYLEVKPGQPTDPIIKIVSSFLDQGWQADDFLFASFDFAVLKVLYAALPDIPIVVGERWSGTRATYRARQLNTKLLSMQQRWLWSGFIRPMAKRGYKIHAFTMNNPAKARRFARYGLHAIFTDYPDCFDR